MPNRLAGETSPYLLQHKDNPVDWYPWGLQALASAKLQDKPILLSIGYSACHWCHVMAHESFEDPAIAELMNSLFVNIKVDREERPDIDSIYMAAVQSMTGQGGWPLTVFLTPDGRPFYGGTYFPPEDRRGHAGFTRVLAAVADAYRTQRGELLTQSSKVIGAIQSQAAPRRGDGSLNRDVIVRAFLGMISNADDTEGGFGVQPKFPQPSTYEFLLRYWHKTGSNQARDAVMQTLEKMARGGLYDQVGGGFHRYSTDNVWLVPHFEKMLYDNAQLASLYLQAWQVGRSPLFNRVTEETISYVLREMTHESGGFFSATDADSEGEEGKYFVWLDREVEAALGPELGRIAAAYWGTTRDGNFEGKNILNVPRSDRDVAADLGLSVEALLAAISEARAKLYEVRKQRVPPGTDTKVITSWNALMLKALAECGAVMGRRDWIEAARKNASFLLGQLTVNGRLQRTWKDGHAKQNAFLEDYATLTDALVSLYEATFETRWLLEARRLAEEMFARFWDERDSVFYDTPSDHETLIMRPRDIFDNATPCGGSAAAMALLRLSVFAGDVSYEAKAVATLEAATEIMGAAPQGAANWLAALDFYLAKRQEVVIVGRPDDPATLELLAEARRDYAPDRALAGSSGPVPTSTKPPAHPQIGGFVSPLLEGRGLVNGKPTAYVCEHYVCQSPVTDPAALAAQLR